MWQKVAVLFVVFIYVSNSAGDIRSRSTNGLLQRLKRSPHNYDYPSPPSPPPPLPQPTFWRPYWIPPPPHKKIYWEHFIQQQAHDEGQTALDSHSAEFSTHKQNQYVGWGNDGQDGLSPCEKCPHRNTAVSNAKSDTGSAVAIAISKGNNET